MTLAARLAVPLFCIPALLIGAAAPSSITLGSSPNASVFGRAVTLTAAVTPSSATGRVTFYDGVTILGIAKLTGGQAALTTILLSAGSRSLRAYYAGNSGTGPSSSAPTVQTVNAAPAAALQPPVSYAAGVEPSWVIVGDFNRDGKADLVVAHIGGSGISVLLGKGDRTFLAAVACPAGDYPRAVAAGDFNGDGNADLAVALANGPSPHLVVLLGAGDGSFGAPVSYGSGAYPTRVAVADFNGDGNADLVANDLLGNRMSVLLGRGDGTFQEARNTTPANSPDALAVGDFNSDGKPDLATGSSTSNNVSIMLGNGDGTFRAPMNFSAGAIPSSLAIGDFKRRGKVDLAVANLGGNNVSILFGNGDGTFASPVNYAVGSAPYSIAVADLNGDGGDDLITANFNSNNVSILTGKSDGTFQPAANYAAGNSPQSVAVGDFNQDGTADAVTANISGDDASVLLGVFPAPQLSILVTHTGDFTQGQSGAVFTISVGNTGHAPTSGTVTITGSLGAGLTAIAIAGSGWNCLLQTLTCTRGDTLKAGELYAAIALTVAVAAGAPGGATIQVSVQGGGDPSGSPQTSSDFTTTFTTGQVLQAWAKVNFPPELQDNGSEALLMTDGTVMVHQSRSPDWLRLAPDKFGSYVTGVWSRAASMQSGYAPGAFASAVLPDGRLVVIGGEYNGPSSVPVETNLGAIYDPVSDKWTPLSAPAGWDEIGDAPSTVLSDGRFLLGHIYSAEMAKLDPATLTWTILKAAGKADSNAEEGWTLLPDGSVLTVDTSIHNQSERYLPKTDTWVSAGNTIAPLVATNEIGPQVLRPNGTVFVTGETGHTAIYNLAAGTWSPGPDFPVSGGLQFYQQDGPGVLLTNGNVLLNGHDSQVTEFFFEFDGVRLNPVPSPGGCTVLLPLPTGQALCTGGPSREIYTPSGAPAPAWAPAIATAPNVVQAGDSYTVTGTQFNGLSQAVGFGDDYQGATNYPLVRIVNTATGHVFYCRTHDHSTMGVATGSAIVSTHFDVPPSIDAGPSTLVVVANGIASQPWNVVVAATPAIGGVEGGGLSVPPVTQISANGYFTIFGAMLANGGTARVLAPSDLVKGTLPTNLGSTCINVGSARAFPTYVSPTQINAIAPAIPASGSALVSVVANCGGPNETTSPAVSVPLAAASPEFLYWVQNANGQNPVIAVDAVHGDYIGPPGLIPGLTFRAARPGDVLTVYGIGFGPTAAGPLPGAPPPSADSVPSGYSLTIGKTPVSPPYVGVSPGSAGLYQVNFTLPNLGPGNYQFVLNVNGASTPTGPFIAIGD